MRERLELTEADGLRALEDHAHDKALFARQKYGGEIGYDEIHAMLDDAEVVRFPTTVSYQGDLLPGEFAHVEPRGARPSDGYTVFVHPLFATQRELLPMLIAYHLVRVNYGDMATTDVAEIFGSTLIGVEREYYYRKLCEAADSVS